MRKIAIEIVIVGHFSFLIETWEVGLPLDTFTLSSVSASPESVEDNESF